MNRLWLVGIFVLAVILGALGQRIFGRSSRLTPSWGEIGILAICIGWSLGLLLFGTLLVEATMGVLILSLSLLGVAGVFLGLQVGWCESRSVKRWVTYAVVVGGAAMLLLA